MRPPNTAMRLALHMVAFLCTLAVPCFGASIGGKIVDETGAPVQGVRIEVGGTDQEKPMAATTSDAAGQFTLIVPGEGNYRISAEREGFFLFTAPDVLLAESTPLEIRLNHLKELTESLDVRYSPPLIDPQQTSDTKRLNNQEILNIPYPASQDFRNALPLMQGAIQDNSGRMHFNGGDTNQTNYRLNGFDVSDPASGLLETRLNVDTVQTLEWEASRFSPDKGKGSAGTLDVKTEMGDNHWRVASASFIPSFSSQDGLHIDHWSPRVKISGPIVKSKLWFHNGFDTFYSVHSISGLPEGEDRTRSLISSNLSRVQWNLSDRQILTASFLVNLGQDSRLGLNFLNPLETTVNRKQALYLGTIKDQITIGGGLLEFGFAETQTYWRSSPQGNAMYVMTPFGNRGNYYVDQTRNGSRQEWLLNGYLPPLHARGSHQIQMGADVERSNIDQSTVRHDYSVLRVNTTVARHVAFVGDPRQFRSNIETYGYLLDRWSPFEGLLIEAGARAQWDEYTGGAPPAPRASAAYAPGWLHGTKISAGWGIFYDALALNTLVLGQDQSSLSTFYLGGGTAVGPVLTRFLLRPQDLRLPRFAITSFSVEHELPGHIYSKMNLVSREGSRGFTFQNFAADPTLNDYVLTNVRRQRYRAAEFSVRRTFASRYEWFLSYTRSEANSNAPIDYSLENPIFAPQAPGPLPWDAPNRFLMWGWAPVEKRWFPGFLQPVIGETTFSVLTDYHTGFPFNVLNEVGNLVGAPNRMRFPDYSTVNIAFERRFPFRGYLWALRVGVINVLDRQNPNVVNSDIDSPDFLRFSPGQSRAVNVRMRFLGKK